MSIETNNGLNEMKVTAHRIHADGHDAMVLGFSQPCMISIHKDNLIALCNGNEPYRMSFGKLKSGSPADQYYSTIDLSHLTHEQHATMYLAAAEMNDAHHPLGEDEDANVLIAETNTISVDLEQNIITYTSGRTESYQRLNGKIFY